MLWEYIKEVLDASWDFATGGSEVIEFLICGLAFLLPKWIAKHEKQKVVSSHSAREILWHKFLTNDSWRFFVVVCAFFICHFLIIAPYQIYKRIEPENEALRAKVDDRFPKLEGFIHRVVPLDYTASTNSTVLVDVSVSNLGEMPSYAEEYGLKVIISTNESVIGEEIEFTNEYTEQFAHKNQTWLLDLKRNQLIAEKTISPIPYGDHKRGWLAYRLRGVKTGQYNLTNVIFSFIDNYGKRIAATNGFWMGRKTFLTNSDDLADVDSGAENIFYPVYPEIMTNWLPPELPPDCSNVVVCLGADVKSYSRFMAEISPDEGTKFAIKDIPDFFLTGIENSPDYDPSAPDMWLRYSTGYTIGGKTVQYPVQPIIVSNRLYVEVEIPFSNEKHQLVMSDSFDTQLHKPRHWDRNYSTNYYANGIGGGGTYAYEVVNELKNPVLQVNYAAPNVVIVNGIFQVDSNSILVAFGQQPQLFTFQINDQNPTQGVMTASLQAETFHETVTINSNETIASFGQRLTNEFFRPIFKYQKPIFKYPSSKNLGVFEDYVFINNKSVTNTVEKPQ